MVESCDVGSLPFKDDINRFLAGARDYGQVNTESTLLFEDKVVSGFIDKAQAGINVPNYPQFRDMTQMFIDMIEGLAKVSGGYIETGTLTLKSGKGLISETQAIKNHSQGIYQKLGQPFKLRICITGPYTISSFFAYKDGSTFTRLGDVLGQIIDANIFSNKHGSAKLVSVDEPVFGFVDDPLLDRGSEGREKLLKAWESIAQRVRAKGAQACLHLHNTSDELFWETRVLNLIESHVNDSFYQATRTKERLESTDKFLKASIAVTDFDQLIRSTIIAKPEQKLSETSLNEKIAETWKKLTKKQIDPIIFVENIKMMKQRLIRILTYFGENRVPYAGPECGMKSFPTYESALECLRRVSKAVTDN